MNGRLRFIDITKRGAETGLGEERCNRKTASMFLFQRPKEANHQQEACGVHKAITPSLTLLMPFS